MKIVTASVARPTQSIHSGKKLGLCSDRSSLLSAPSSTCSALIVGVGERDEPFELRAGCDRSSLVAACSAFVDERAALSSGSTWLDFAFFLRLEALLLGDEGEEEPAAVAAAEAFRFLLVVFVPLFLVVSLLGLRIRPMLVLNEAAVIGFPDGLKSVAALAQSI
jgi:hypothetical protein